MHGEGADLQLDRLAREADDRAVGAPGFRNAADTDPSLPANREWSRGILGRIGASTAGDATIADALITDAAVLEQTVARVREASQAWGALPATETSGLPTSPAGISSASRMASSSERGSTPCSFCQRSASSSNCFRPALPRR